ncbi:MAG TPA: sugar phosphate isomerase/epimerase family protein [Candidatus Brocadiia bacterium]|nr:sugar phosphate isomerase/epimerase family protein [Candidatus Brocadiia bacterium]
MGRPVTLCTGQWADLKLTDLAKMAAGWGYDGLELACWGDHFDPMKGATDKKYCDGQRAKLKKCGLNVWAISNHLAGQMVLDLNDERSDGWAPPECSGKPEAKREWAIECMKNSARAAKNLGIGVVCGFTGSPIWHLIYDFPAIPRKTIDDAFAKLAKVWNPILDVFGQCGVKFALEVHPTEIAFDLYSAKRAVEVLDGRPEFGFNFDPSHLQWQGVHPAKFIDEFPDRIYHMHVKDAAVTLDGKSGILSSHLAFGDGRRGWDFRSPGHGDVDFEAIIRSLNRANYQGPLSVEWEDSGMDREHGAAEALEFVKSIDFKPSVIKFDAQFEKK